MPVVVAVFMLHVYALTWEVFGQLVEFATHGWRDVEPLPQNRSPTSQYGRAIGFLRMCEAPPPAVQSPLLSAASL
jgi:hypothetical protein